MVRNISKLMLVAAFVAPVSAFAANGDNPGYVATKGYVDSGLIQKANRTEVTAITDSLGSAAYVDTTAFDAAGTAAGVQTNLDTFTNRPAGFATAAQGALADTALQSADLTDYARTDGLGTAAYEDTTAFDAAGTAAGVQTNLDTFTNRLAGFATAAQGALADTALQAADLADYATNEDLALKANSLDVYTQTQADTLFQAKHSCSAGQMLLTGAGGAVSCIDVENGTYTE